MNADANIQQAIADLALVRRAVEQTSGAPASVRREALGANLLLQLVALVTVGVLLGFELAMGQPMSFALRVSAQDPELGMLGLANIFIALVFLVVCAYFVVWRAARHAKRPLGEFIGANFVYLRRLSFIGDLVVKFSIISLLMLAGRPVWIVPLLALFVGDYVIQGRFFNLPLRSALLLGLACFGAAAYLALAGVYALAWPLALFLVICVISLVRTWLARRAVVADTSEGEA